MDSIIKQISVFLLLLLCFSCTSQKDKNSMALVCYDNGNKAFSLGQYYPAIKEYNQSLDLNPNFEDVYSKLASAYIQVGEFNHAINTYFKLIALNPTIPEAHFQLGNVYCEIGNYNKALNSYKEAIKLDSSLYLYHYSLGLLYQQNFSNFTEAIKCYEQVLLLNHTHSESYYYLGIAYHKMSNVDKAIAAYKHAAQLGNQKAQNYLLSKDIRW